MEDMTTKFIIGMVAVVALVLVLQALASRGTAALYGAMSGNTKKRGRAAVGKSIQFSVPVAPEAVIEKVVELLELRKGGVFGLKLGALSEDGQTLMIVGGSLALNQLQFVVNTEPANGGCTGIAAVHKWSESDGHVTMTEAIERIQGQVRAAVEALGGQVTESTMS